ncbi:hypothetical protein GQX74_003202 [Glossina fuscipes]|nr:hypothetical protein GQX74_003202 [Glossina fuscipes]
MYCKIINFNEQHPCTTTDTEVVLLPTTPTCTVNHLALTRDLKPDNSKQKMHTQLVGPLLGIILNVVIQCVEANLTLGFKATKISGKYKPDLRLFNVSKKQQHPSTSASFQISTFQQCVNQVV